MSPVKLHYFNLRGRAEYIRWILEFCGVEYEDIRYTFEEWPQIKQSGQFITGQVPQLDYDGFNLAETDAICHYVAKKHNLAGKDLQEETTCMMVANMINGYLTKIAKVRFEKDEKKKEELRKDLKEKDAPQFFGTIVKMLTKNGGKHLVGNKVTYADILLACMLDGVWLMAKPEDIEKFPQIIKDFKSDMLALPAIKAWVAKRPATDF